MKRRMFVTVMLALVFAAASSNAQQSSEDERTIESIRDAVLRLPYYGVFDFLAFQFDKGTVTLSGFVYQPSLKREVVSAVKRVPRVDDVVDKIEELPVSQNDDRIRWRTFDRIYSDSSLSRYAPGGGLSRFDRRFNMPRFPGMQPFGTYPIHVIVRGGRTLLLGVVDSEFDKTLAGVRAREVPGTFGVENELVVASGKGTR
jgi:hyperosmotically inducible periplasmic protein